MKAAKGSEAPRESRLFGGQESGTAILLPEFRCLGSVRLELEGITATALSAPSSRSSDTRRWICTSWASSAPLRYPRSRCSIRGRRLRTRRLTLLRSTERRWLPRANRSASTRSCPHQDDECGVAGSTAVKFSHAAGVEVAALRTLVVCLDRQHPDPAAAGGTDRALGVGVDGTGGWRRLGRGGGKLIVAIDFGHAVSIPKPNPAGPRIFEVRGCGAFLLPVSIRPPPLRRRDSGPRGRCHRRRRFATTPDARHRRHHPRPRPTRHDHVDVFGPGASVHRRRLLLCYLSMLRSSSGTARRTG